MQFESPYQAGRTAIHQVLGVRTAANGSSGMPATRASFVVPGKVGAGV